MASVSFKNVLKITAKITKSMVSSRSASSPPFTTETKTICRRSYSTLSSRCAFGNVDALSARLVNRAPMRATRLQCVGSSSDTGIYAGSVHHIQRNKLSPSNFLNNNSVGRLTNEVQSEILCGGISSTPNCRMSAARGSGSRTVTERSALRMEAGPNQEGKAKKQTCSLGKHGTRFRSTSLKVSEAFCKQFNGLRTSVCTPLENIQRVKDSLFSYIVPAIDTPDRCFAVSRRKTFPLVSRQRQAVLQSFEEQPSTEEFKAAKSITKLGLPEAAIALDTAKKTQTNPQNKKLKHCNDKAKCSLGVKIRSAKLQSVEDTPPSSENTNTVNRTNNTSLFKKWNFFNIPIFPEHYGRKYSVSTAEEKSNKTDVTTSYSMNSYANKSAANPNVVKCKINKPSVKLAVESSDRVTTKATCTYKSLANCTARRMPERASKLVAGPAVANSVKLFAKLALKPVTQNAYKARAKFTKASKLTFELTESCAKSSLKNLSAKPFGTLAESQQTVKSFEKFASKSVSEDSAKREQRSAIKPFKKFNVNDAVKCDGELTRKSATKYADRTVARSPEESNENNPFASSSKSATAGIIPEAREGSLENVTGSNITAAKVNEKMDSTNKLAGREKPNVSTVKKSRSNKVRYWKKFYLHL